MPVMTALCHAIPIGKDTNLVLALFLGGFGGSITHCTLMCGPFVLAQISTFITTSHEPRRLDLRKLLISYHLGRMTTYIALGMLVSLLTVNILQFPALAIIPPLLLVLAGVLFLASAFSFLLPQLAIAFCAAPSWMMTRVGMLFPRHSLLKGYALGIMLGFLPCGLVYAALLAVASTKDPIHAAIGMAAFALGTAPALMAIGHGGYTLLPKRKTWVKAMSAALMIFNGMTLFTLAGKGLI